MKSVALITNIAPDNFSGGFSAMNRAMFEFLSREHFVDYIGPVNPKPSLRQHSVSKARRVLALGGDFFFFSERRLESVRRVVEERLAKSEAEYAIFHGFTPWIHTHPSVPYVAWSDCTFWQYVHIYHDARCFRKSDLERIKASEEAWLRRAARVIFRSRWAAAGAIRDYQLDEARVGVVGNYGFATPPLVDAYGGAHDFLMITTNFRQKGGAVAVEALRRVRRQHPDTRLLIIGDHPGRRVLREPGVDYLGWIDKSDPAQVDLLSQTLARARCLVHPTTADTNPMVLIEAGYSGCPAISTKRYAIPELVIDGVSGLLLDDPTDVPALTGAMVRMLDQDASYLRMRQAARAHMLERYTKEVFRSRLSAQIAEVELGLQQRIPVLEPRIQQPLATALLDVSGQSQAGAAKPEYGGAHGQDRHKINFITNIRSGAISGGFSGMNAAAFGVASAVSAVDYIGPISPAPDPWAKNWSKARRVAGSKGNFSFFSSARLREIAHEVHQRASPDVQLDFFHGFTPWVLANPSRPFMAWSDCTFRDYITFYHHRSDFLDADLARIEESEARWLSRAERVLFTSRWAADRAIRDYGLDQQKVGVVGIAGAIPAPGHDVYLGGKEYAFISTDFEAKGGPLVIKALEQVRRHESEASLVVVGADPGPKIRRQPGVRYAGFLHKENPLEQARFVEIISTCRCLVHPTRADISPLILVEAAYCGCPAISSRRFAIPEIIDDRKTGLLLDDPESVDELAAAMLWMLGNETAYGQMRRAAWELGRSRLSSSSFENKLQAEIQAVLGRI